MLFQRIEIPRASILVRLLWFLNFLFWCRFLGQGELVHVQSISLSETNIRPERQLQVNLASKLILIRESEPL